MRTTLYKLDCNNNVREWTIWIEEHPTKSGWLLVIRYGLLNGQKVFEKYDHDVKETAETDVKRRIRKQLERKGYHTEIPTKRTLKPMLAHTFQDHRDKMPETIIYQPKLDGYRCLGMQNKMVTRTNVPLPAFPHIQHTLSLLPEDIILDGELYNHNSRFQTIMKSRCGFPSTDSFMVEYHVFDCVEPTLPYKTRRVMLADLMIELMDKYEQRPYWLNGQILPFPLITTPTYAGKLTEVENYYNKFIADNYEGVMLRDPDSHYEIDQRSYSLLKYKKRDQDYFKIVDVVAGNKRKTEGVLVCIDSKGMSFNCTFAASVDQKRYIFSNPTSVIGRFILVEYLGLTDSGKPRNAQGLRLQ